MTLILGRASRRFVTHAADRLVTLGTQPFDSTANKTVIYAARDGILALGYTGLAYLDGVPTDEWIVQELTSLMTGVRDSSLWSTGVILEGPFYQCDTGQLLFNVAELLTSAYELLPSALHKKFDQTMIIAVGWRWDRKDRWRPLIASIAADPSQRLFYVRYKPRHWWIGPDEPGTLLGGPVGNLPPDFEDEVAARVHAVNDVEGTEDGMAALIEHVSKTSPYVGSDAITISLSPPTLSAGRIRYHRKSPNTAFGFEPFYTPWIVGKDIAYGPAIITDHITFPLGRYLLHAKAPGSPVGPQFLPYERPLTQRPPRPHVAPAPQQPPGIKECLIAEAIERLPDDELTVTRLWGSSPNASVRAPALPGHVKLAFAFIGDRGTGQAHAVQFKLSKDTGETLPPSPVAMSFMAADRQLKLILNATHYYPGPGAYVMELVIDGDVAFTAKYSLAIGK